ncbi:MAG: hypothetical protein DRP01_10765 [Archaeoglobales archaeon]|nr:MAG: hypothetical protein DRP01_10765 [Archaeoglobales archaeon]
MSPEYRYLSLLPYLLMIAVVLILIDVLILNLYNSINQLILATLLGVISFSISTISIQTLKSLKYSSEQWDIKMELLETIAVIILLSSIAIIFLIILRQIL